MAIDLGKVVAFLEARHASGGRVGSVSLLVHMSDGSNTIIYDIYEDGNARAYGQLSRR